ncbi:type IV-A pilus assembly ATPase PilB [Parvibium lacunae]|uniref:Type IV-A pilus assembly ATPase PilB n=1 Tax=Parvibium lacunae TaxID=1888893 RepID=A0A368L355_9BURK|nr:type IV-A pilus assembly ATPase PilB [Parvibium lacunae]RCS57538.1 type IV-A pilus assembly ATPase PilB [Parvibium lacunae]
MAVSPSAASQAPASTLVLSGLARALVQGNALRADLADDLFKKANANKSAFIDELLSNGALSPRQVARFCADTFGYALLDLSAVSIEALPSGILDSKLSKNLRAVALNKRGNRLAVGVSDPTNQQISEQIKFQTQLAVDLVVVEHDKLLQLIGTLTQSTEGSLNTLIGDDFDLGDLEEQTQHDTAALDQDADVDDAPVVKFLQKILFDAINQGASDLHFEPYEKFYRIRFRVDGQLREVAQPPLAIKEKLASRIKVISRMDIAEKRIPQDGRMKLAVSATRAIDFRVSSLPTLFGEKIVMRILDPSSAKLGIDALGYDPEQKTVLMETIQRPYGMVLVTGPTGSGKTVSLYTCLNILNQPGVNISTAEDPAEINLPGINQVNVNDKAGLTFAAALKSFLRQDPDVIMVGEIRDLETADISIKAAQTGHMVFSTLHTNDAPSTITRLMNMGVAPFNIASSILLITAQRLARRLCSCKQPLPMSDTALLEAGFREEDLDGSWTPYKPVGCERCGGSGYKGRVGIYQVMPITETMQKIILNQGNAIQIAEQAEKDGVNSLRRAGLMKVKQGLTSIEEVLGCTNE